MQRHDRHRFLTATLVAVAIALLNAPLAAAGVFSRDPAYHQSSDLSCAGPGRPGDAGSINLTQAVVTSMNFDPNVSESQWIHWGSQVWRYDFATARWVANSTIVWEPGYWVNEAGPTNTIWIGGAGIFGPPIARTWNVVQPGYYAVVNHFYWSPRQDRGVPARFTTLLATAPNSTDALCYFAG